MFLEARPASGVVGPDPVNVMETVGGNDGHLGRRNKVESGRPRLIATLERRSPKDEALKTGAEALRVKLRDQPIQVLSCLLIHEKSATYTAATGGGQTENPRAGFDSLPSHPQVPHRVRPAQVVGLFVGRGFKLTTAKH